MAVALKRPFFVLTTVEVVTFPLLRSSVGAGIMPHTKPVSLIVSAPVWAKTAFKLKRSLLPETAASVPSFNSRGFAVTVMVQLFVLLFPAASVAVTLTVFVASVLLTFVGIVYDHGSSASLRLSEAESASANSFFTVSSASSSKTVIGE